MSRIPVRKVKRNKPTYRMSVLHKYLVELANGDDVDDTVHVVETVNPLAPL